jgi:hypothetical protein
MEALTAFRGLVEHVMAEHEIRLANATQLQ